MADVLKVLGQSNPVAAVLTDMYTVPSSTSATTSSLTVCNQSVSPVMFRVSIAVAGAADTAKQYLYYDLPLAAKDTFVATIGMTLATTDVVRVYANSGTASFQLFGVEVS